MAKKAARRKSAPKKKSGSRRRSAAVSAGGPVTLEEARVLALGPTPKGARRTRGAGSTRSATPAVTPQNVGIEREKLDRENRAEDEQRVREYKATMEIMKKRGVKGLAPAGKAPKRRGPAAARAVSQPLQVFAEGDSWFDYPIPFFGGGIIPRLEKQLGVPVLNLAKAGDEARNMMGVEQRKKLANWLRRGCPAGGDWDALLFSGGGNDIVGEPMVLWITDFRPGVSPARLIDQPRFDAALALVRSSYEDLIQLRDTLSPNTLLVFQAYDFAIPDGRGICHMGPWLKPSLDLRRFPTRTAGFGVVKAMLTQFAVMLKDLETSHRGVKFINGQGTLAVTPRSWHNELHPSKAGYNKFATLFRQELKRLFPNRVP